MTRLLPAAFLALAVLTQTARAEPCADAVTQADMNMCAADDFRAADADLNRAYQALRSRLSGEGAREALLTAQRAWLALRDAECEFSTSAARGGSVHAMLVRQCLAEQTRSRTERLKTYLACADRDGDLACPR
jgi:uncharacterized protein YecT (DUF1311 family)